MRLLLVDDVPAERRLLRGQLEAEGNVVFVADDGVAALELLDKQQIDAVFAEWLMPRMDGLTLCRRIRTDPRFQTLPFIVYARTYNSPAEQRAAAQAGVDKFLMKPASTGVLMAALREACDNSHPRKVKVVEREMGVMREYNAALVRQLAENNAELASKVQELRDTSELNRQIVTSAREGIAVFDRELRFRLFNPFGEEITGWKAAEVMGKTLDEILPAAAVAPALGRLRRALQGESMESGDTLNPARTHGPYRWLSTNSAPLRDAAGEIVGVISVINDVTARKDAEQRILGQARLLDLASDAISERGLDDRVRYWNQGAERLYGWRADEMIGRTVERIISPHDPNFAAAKEAVLRTGEWTGELQHTDRQGRAVIMHSRWTLLRDELGEPKSILVISTDITSRKSLEAQFFRAQRLEAIGTLSSGIAHDLNNILAPILMSAPILRLNLPPKEAEKILTTIEVSAQRGANLVRQLLTFGRGAEGQHRAMQLEPLQREIHAIAQQTFPKNITVVCESPHRLWPVRGDPTQLHQMLLNLAVNARDAMPQGGTLTLGAENTEVDESFAGMIPDARPGKYVMLRVADNGTGMPPELIDKIFDPFFTTKEAGKGTGLGLATVQGVVKSHGGFVHLRSELGQGTTFFVYLPAADESSPQTEDAAAARVPHGNGELVLVVDDEENIRSVVATALTRHGYQVAMATDGADAVAQYARLAAKVRAVITDIDMPVMDGVTMIQVLRRMNPGLGVLVSTGLASSAHIETRTHELATLGIAPESILVKPYTTEMILRALHALLVKQA